jgi:hypothetical protein
MPKDKEEKASEAVAEAESPLFRVSREMLRVANGKDVVQLRSVIAGVMGGMTYDQATKLLELVTRLRDAGAVAVNCIVEERARKV